MKFVHIGDIHLGKTLHQYNLIDNQRDLLMQVLSYMDDNDIRLLLIAGDVYDRSTPSQEAVNLLDEFLTEAILNYNIKVLMISGNHDNNDRLNFASALLRKKGLYIETYLKKEMEYVEIEDTRFYLLPYFKPGQVRALFDNDVKTYDEAMQYYLSNQNIDKNYKNVLITHQFIGGSSLTSESEVLLSVGGSEIIGVEHFDDFDYVALGHLHAPQSVFRDTIRYSGSLMRYSFDEVNQNKSITVVDTDDFSINLHELTHKQNVCFYKGTFEQFLDHHFIERKNDLLSFELENQSLVPHAIDQLRILYPHLLTITYSFLFDKERFETNLTHIEQMSHEELYVSFYKEMTNNDLNEEQLEIVKEILEKVGEKYEN